MSQVGKTFTILNQCNALWVKANGKKAIGILELCLSFYSHPNISDGNFILDQNIPHRFGEAEINIFRFSFSISLQNV